MRTEDLEMLDLTVVHDVNGEKMTITIAESRTGLLDGRCPCGWRTEST